MKEHRVIAIWGVLMVCPLILALVVCVQAVSAGDAYQAAPTSTHNRCRVIGIANVNSGVNLNVRPVPARTGTPLAVINGTANPQSIIDVRGDWLMLCSLDDKFISSDPALVSFVTVTPGPTQAQATPTRLVTNTPTPSATVRPETFTWITVDTDGDGFLESTLRCLNPCAMQTSDKEPTP